MIKIGKLTDYGILVMAYLARQDGGLRSAQEIAKGLGITLPTVNKILKLLVRGGLLESQRGIKGGYRLVRNPAVINMVEIISALEGPVALTDCSSTRSAVTCRREPTCHARTKWQRLTLAVNEALAKVSLAEMTIPSQPIHWHAPSAT